MPPVKGTDGGPMTSYEQKVLTDLGNEFREWRKAADQERERRETRQLAQDLMIAQLSTKMNLMLWIGGVIVIAAVGTIVTGLLKLPGVING